MRLHRFAIPAVVALGAALLLPATAAQATEPWANNTVFVAESGQRSGFGGLWAVAPDGTKTLLGSGSAEDVAVAADGTVYWVECSGGLYQYTPGSGPAVEVADPGNCPTSVGIGPNGTLAIGTFDGVGLYDPSDQSFQMAPDTPTGISSLASDADGDAYFASGSQQFSIIPPGGSAVAVQGYFGGEGIASIRVDDNFNLYAAAPNAHTFWRESSSTDASAQWDTGYYTDGAVSDSDGNWYASALVDSPSTEDAIMETHASDQSVTVLADGFDTPKGLAVWPPAAPASRAESSVDLTTTAGTGTTTVSSVKLTAQVTGVASGNQGVVQFSVDGQPLGDVVPLIDGTASERTALPKGSHQLLATYLGNATVRPSQSAATAVNVAGLRTTTTLSTDNLTVPQEFGVAVTAHVAALRAGFAAPTGEVSFYVNGKFSGYYAPDASGNATAPNLSLKPGANTVRAVYSGDELYSSSAGQLTMTAVPPLQAFLTTKVRYLAMNANGSQHVAIRVVISGQHGHAAPTGTITAEGRRFTCTPAAMAAGNLVSSCTGSAPPGFSTVTLDYSGDDVYGGFSDFETLFVGGDG